MPQPSRNLVCRLPHDSIRQFPVSECRVGRRALPVATFGGNAEASTCRDRLPELFLVARRDLPQSPVATVRIAPTDIPITDKELLGRFPADGGKATNDLSAGSDSSKPL